MKKKLLTLLAMAAALSTLSAYADPMQIANAADWAAFASSVNSGNTSLDAVMTADVTLTQDSPMVGTDSNLYAGDFDGAGHTLTLNWAFSGVTDVAPFAFVAACNIHDLRTAGTISSDEIRVSGLIGSARPGGAIISRCRSSVQITSIKTGDATAAGFIGATHYGSQTIQVTDCLFDGSLLGLGANNCGGFAGFNYDATTLSVSNSLFAPQMVTVSEEGSATFSRRSELGAGKVQLQNCYYTQTLGTAQGADASSMSAEDLVAALGENWTVVDNKPMLEVFASSGSGSGDPDPGTDPSDPLSQYTFTFVSEGATLGTVSARTPPVPVRRGASRFAGYYTAETGGVKVYSEKCEIDEDALSDLSTGATLYARWEAVEPSFGGFVYRGQLNTLSGQPAEGDNGATYTKTMHFRVYDGDSTTIPLWQSGAKTVTVNADGSFVYKFGDDALTGLIATGRVSHVGVALGNNADTAVELKPRSALSSVSAVNRALAAEGAAVDVRIGNLVTENALVAADATFSHLDITGTVDAPATEVSVSPLTLGAGDRTRLLRGNGVNLFSSENPTVLKSNTGAVMKGQYLDTTAPYNGVVLFATAASGDRALRCPAVVQFCRAGEKLYAPTSDLDGLKVIFFPFIGKEGE